MDEKVHLLDQAQDQLKAQTSQDVLDRISSLQADLKALDKENESLNARLANQEADNIFQDVREVAGYQVIAQEAKVKDMGQLRQLADKWKESDYSDILVLGLRKAGKVNLIVACKDSAISDGIKAGDLIKHLAQFVGGGGGGRPDLAQAGGSKPEGLDKALQESFTWIEDNGN